MTTSRLATLLGVVALGVLSIFLLPRSAAQPTGLTMKDGAPILPESIAGWEGKDMAITELEIKTLGLGTQFARKSYRDAGGNSAVATIVLSGRDISNSLHRPERCLDAQGWIVKESEELPITLADKNTFPVRRLYNTQRKLGKDGKVVANLEIFTYYWFVGEKALTAGPYERFFIDNRDRMFRGVDQRWAYVTVTVGIPTARDPQDQPKVRAFVDEKMQAFIAALAPTIHGPGVHYQ